MKTKTSDQVKQVYFIVNPIAGNITKDTFPALVESHLDKKLFQWNIAFSQHAGHAAELSHEALRNGADIVVAVIDGADADSGTAWEMGYAYAHNKPVIAVRTDFRRVGMHEQVNLMLEESSKVVSSTIELLESVKSPLIGKNDI